MTAFDSLSSLAGDSLAQVHGVSVVYTAPGGTGATVSARVWHEAADTDTQGEGDEVTIRRARCVIGIDQVADPVRLATVTYGGETWTVDRVHKISGEANELHLAATAVTASGREGRNVRRLQARDYD